MGHFFWLVALSRGEVPHVAAKVPHTAAEVPLSAKKWPLFELPEAFPDFSARASSTSKRGEGRGHGGDGVWGGSQRTLVENPTT